jgi:hypothetical protein
VEKAKVCKYRFRNLRHNFEVSSVGSRSLQSSKDDAPQIAYHDPVVRPPLS